MEVNKIHVIVNVLIRTNVISKLRILWKFVYRRTDLIHRKS